MRVSSEPLCPWSVHARIRHKHTYTHTCMHMPLDTDHSEKLLSLWTEVQFCANMHPINTWKQTASLSLGREWGGTQGSFLVGTGGNLLVIHVTNVSSWCFPRNKNQLWCKGGFKHPPALALVFSRQCLRVQPSSLQACRPSSPPPHSTTLGPDACEVPLTCTASSACTNMREA